MDSSQLFAALVIYPTNAAAQRPLAERLAQMAESTLRSMPGFVSGRVYLSEDGEHIITLVEWLDRESFLHFRQSDLGRAGTQLAGALHPTPYWLTREGEVRSEK